MCLDLYLVVPVSQVDAIQMHTLSVHQVQYCDVCTVLLPNAGTHVWSYLVSAVWCHCGYWTWSSAAYVPFPPDSWAPSVGRTGCSSKCFKWWDPLVVLSLPFVLQQGLIFTRGWTPICSFKATGSLCTKTWTFESAVVSPCFSFHKRHSLSQIMLKSEVLKTENSSQFLL